MKQLTNARILVTGGAGFIGSNLVEKFLAQDNEVTVLDNFSTGKQENIEAFYHHPHFTLISEDIRNMDACRNAVDGIDYVFHEAALGSVPRSVSDPAETTSTNITGFVNVLFAAVKAKVKRFIYAASSAAYGDSPTLPKVEEDIGKPLSPYAITKYVNELYAANFHDLYGIDTIGLRYFNVFGRRQDPNGAYAAVIPKFVMNLMDRKPPVINGDGTFSRDFTYIDNVLQANELAALTDCPASLNQVYNIAYGEAITINELVEILRSQLSEFDPEIAHVIAKHGPERTGDIPHSLASIDKAQRLLGYHPQFSVRDGLSDAVRWYFEHYKV